MAVLDRIFTLEQVEAFKTSLDIEDNSMYKIGKQGKYTKEQLMQLRAELDGCKVLKLKVAVELPQTSIRNICAWCRKNLTAEIVLDLEVDPSVIAGAEISFEGHYFDLTQKQELITILASYD